MVKRSTRHRALHVKFPPVPMALAVMLLLLCAGHARAQMEAVTPSVAQQADSLRGRWRISTNAVGWGMAIANATGEWSFRPHWSAALSLYYSAWNYGTSTRKFRTFVFRPEARWWLRPDNTGFFVDAHVGMYSFNFARSRWRYRLQDTRGRHPALGGGIGVGYHWAPWQKADGNRRHWSFQAQAGVGVYHLHYDRFVNHPGGQKVDTRTSTFFGIDNVAISVVYTFTRNPRKK